MSPMNRLDYILNPTSGPVSICKQWSLVRNLAMSCLFLKFFSCKIKVPFKKEFKKVVHNNYIQKTKDKLSKLTDNSKLYLYNKIKHDIVLEELKDLKLD
jgi:hypothetical protein